MGRLGTPPEVAINEAIELAKRYSEEDGHRFIHAVLKRTFDQLGLKRSNRGGKAVKEEGVKANDI